MFFLDIKCSHIAENTGQTTKSFAQINHLVIHAASIRVLEI